MASFDISIVIVTYNNRDCLPACLDSLSRALDGYASQLVIIDNNSTDGTRQYLVDLSSSCFSNVQLQLNDENTGFTAGVNQGLRHCTGEFVLMLNPDMVFPDAVFRRLLDEFNQPDVGVVSPQFRFPNGRIQPSCRRLPRKRHVIYESLGLSRLFSGSTEFNGWRMPDFDHCRNRDVEQPQGAFLLTRRSVLQNVGLLDERFFMFFSDVEWCRRVLQRGYRIRFVADVHVVHLQGGSVKKRRAAMIITSHRSFVDYFRMYDLTIRQNIATFLVVMLLLIGTAPRLLAAHLK